jgi:hypothetical protein
VSRLAPVQANRIILKALDAGVPDERLAQALNRSTTTIRLGRSLLKDICPEALELLKDKPVAHAAFGLFKHAKPIRQVEMAELMNKVANYGRPYAIALVSGTKPELMADRRKPKRPARPRSEDLARMELEMQSLEKDRGVLRRANTRSPRGSTTSRRAVDVSWRGIDASPRVIKTSGRANVTSRRHDVCSRRADASSPHPTAVGERHERASPRSTAVLTRHDTLSRRQAACCRRPTRV